VTSLFVEAEQEEHRQRAEDSQRAAHDETRRLLQDVSDRLANVETMLRKIDSPPP